MYKKVLFSAALFGLCFFGLSALNGPKAQAALEGENGPIIYIENKEEIIDNDEVEINNVYATQPDGSGQTTVASTEDTITSATISSPDPAGSHQVVFATEDTKLECESGAEAQICEVYSKTSEASLNKVVINGQGEPTSAVASSVVPNMIANDKEMDYNWIPQTSISPDGSKTLIIKIATSTGIFESYEQFYKQMAIVNTQDIGSSTIAVTNITDPAYDPCLNGGFAQDGGIYFTTCPHWNIKSGNNAGLYYLAPGVLDVAKATKVYSATEEEIAHPFFIDTAPNSQKVLVTSIDYMNDREPSNGFSTVCNYGLFFDLGIMHYPGDCQYFLIDSNSGTSQALPEFDELFVPAFFAPNGQGLIGTVYTHRITPLNSVNNNVEQPYTAYYSFADGSIVAISDQIGVQEWAPKAKLVSSTTNVSPATLAYTGNNVMAVFIASLVFLLGGMYLLVTSKNR
jgi:hypothetical protein